MKFVNDFTTLLIDGVSTTVPSSAHLSDSNLSLNHQSDDCENHEAGLKNML